MSFVLLNKKSNIIEITLNRAEKKNALNIALLEELLNTLIKLNADPTIRAMIIRGSENSFSSGLDLNEALEKNLAQHSSDLIYQMFKEIYYSPHLTIAAIKGIAIAGGCGLVCACDFAIATNESTFGFPEVKRGLVPALVSVILKNKVPFTTLQELFLFGELFDANKALSLNIIHKIASDPIKEAYNYAKMANQGGPNAIKITKALLRKIQNLNTQESFDFALKIHEEIRNSEEAQEGLISFKEKRAPSWLANENL